MRVGVLQVDLHIPGSGSLKEKRMVLKSLKERIRAGFNASVAEIDAHDMWQRATIGIAVISNDKRHIDSVLNKIKNCFEHNRNISIIDYQIEII